MGAERAGLDPIIESVADGALPDWAAAESQDERRQRLLDNLRIVARVAEVHRSQAQDAGPESTPATAEVDGQADAGFLSGGGDPDPGHWGPFELRSRVGTGAFGEVFMALDRNLDRVVAVKLLQQRASRSQLAARVLREGRMLARVRHHSVVTVHGAEEHGGRVGLWMEFVHGANLEQLLQAHGPYGANEAALIGQELCRALAAVHGAGLLHRDLKANNVMREKGGRVVLMDFGAGLPTREPAAVGMAGTPLYLAPEVLSGEEATARSDLYSLGVLLFHLVTGDYPVRGTSVDDLQIAHRIGPRARLQDLRPDLPDAFVRVVERALNVDPDRRYRSAGAMQAALARALGVDVGDDEEEEEEEGRPRVTAPAPPKATTGLRSRPGRLAAAAAAVIVAVALGAAARQFFAGAQPAPAVSTASLAVVPFENLTGRAEWDSLAEGVADDLTRQLQRYGFAVKGRGSSARFGEIGATDLGTRLGVGAVVEGSLSVSGKDAALDVKLVEPTGTEVWSRRYTEEVESLGGLHARVASDLASAMGAPPRRPAAAALALHPPEFEAYEAYHKGRVHWEERTREHLLTSVRYFQEAARLDPAYAQPWAGLADAYIILGVPTFGAYRPQEARRLAQAAAVRALELDPQLAEAHASLAFLSFFYDWNWEAAEARFRKAIALNTGYATAHHWYANYLNAMGRQQEAMREIQAAHELEPLSILVHRDFGWHYFFQRNYEAAVEQLQETLARDPGYAAARSLLGRALVEQGRHQEGIAELERVAPELPRGSAFALLAYAYAAAGRSQDAEQELQKLLDLPETEYVSPYYVALVQARLGRVDEALRFLDKGFHEQDTTMVSLKIDPRFDGLRAHPRFQVLLAKMNLQSQP